MFQASKQPAVQHTKFHPSLFRRKLVPTCASRCDENHTIQFDQWATFLWLQVVLGCSWYMAGRACSHNIYQSCPREKARAKQPQVQLSQVQKLAVESHVESVFNTSVPQTCSPLKVKNPDRSQSCTKDRWLEIFARAACGMGSSKALSGHPPSRKLPATWQVMAGLLETS